MVYMDLVNFIDEVSHDRLLSRLAKRITGNGFDHDICGVKSNAQGKPGEE